MKIRYRDIRISGGNGWYICWTPGYRWMRYLYYTKREALKRYYDYCKEASAR